MKQNTNQTILFRHGQGLGVLASIPGSSDDGEPLLIDWREITERGAKSAVARIRQLACQRAILAIPDMHLLRKGTIHRALLLFCPAGEHYLADGHGSFQRVTWSRLILQDLPRLGIALATGFIPVVVARICIRLLTRLPDRRPRQQDPHRLVAYVRVHFFETNFGGTLAHAHGILTGLRKTGFEVLLVSTDEMFGSEIYPNRIRLAPPGLYGDTPQVQEVAHNFKLFVRGWRILKKQRPMFIYQRHHGLTFAGVALSKLLNVPLVLEFNSSELQRARLWGERHYRLSGLIQRVERLTLSSANLVVCVSRPLAQWVESTAPEAASRILIQPNGVDTDRFHPAISGEAMRKEHGLGPDTIVVGFSGSLMPYMGIDVLIESAKVIAERTAEVTEVRAIEFLILGDGGIRQELEEEAKQAVGSRIVFAGAVPFTEIEQHLAACDILVSPHNPGIGDSNFYWSPIKLFEYMAMGRAIIASRVGQIAEVLADEEDALLVPQGSSHDLATAILRLASDPSLRHTLGKRARAKVENKYTWDQVIKHILAKLESLDDLPPITKSNV